jgi:hypothetical protein
MKKRILFLIIALGSQTTVFPMEQSNKNSIKIIGKDLQPSTKIEVEEGIDFFGNIFKNDGEAVLLNAVEGNVKVDSVIFSDKYIHVHAGKEFRGQGLLCADKISIIAQKISFEGTIICNKLCIIESKEKVDPKKFWIIGKGIFSINGKIQQSEEILKDEGPINEKALSSISNIRKRDLKNI